MVFIMLVFESIITGFSILFCLYTFNRAPRDVATVVYAIRDHDVYEAASGFLVNAFCWSATFILLWFLIIPNARWIFAIVSVYMNTLIGVHENAPVVF